MSFQKIFMIVAMVVFINGCGDDAPEQTSETATRQDTSTQSTSSGQTQSSSAGSGDVTITLLPENPTSSDCIRAIIQGIPGRSAMIWKVNGETVSSGTLTELCPENFKRDDVVSVEVGTVDQGAQASVSIGNSPPRVVDISSTPEQVFAGVDISVAPVVEDVDGDNVDFYYQWLINGEPDPLLTEATLPGSSFTKGDTIQVQITPNDFFIDGPVYESYAQPIPNAPPEITSQPPQGITSLDYRYQVEVNDPDDSEFTFRLDEAPEGMSIEETTGLIKWSLAGVTPGDYTIAIVVTDPDGAEGAQEYKLTLGSPQ